MPSTIAVLFPGPEKSLLTMFSKKLLPAPIADCPDNYRPGRVVSGIGRFNARVDKAGVGVGVGYGVIYSTMHTIAMLLASTVKLLE